MVDTVRGYTTLDERLHDSEYDDNSRYGERLYVMVCVKLHDSRYSEKLHDGRYVTMVGEVIRQ